MLCRNELVNKLETLESSFAGNQGIEEETERNVILDLRW